MRSFSLLWGVLCLATRKELLPRCPSLQGWNIMWAKETRSFLSWLCQGLLSQRQKLGHGLTLTS